MKRDVYNWTFYLSLLYNFWNSCKSSGELIPPTHIPKTPSDLQKNIECQLFVDGVQWHAILTAGNSLRLVNFADRTMVVGCSATPEMCFQDASATPFNGDKFIRWMSARIRDSVCARCWKDFARLMHRISVGFPRIIHGIWLVQKSISFYATRVTCNSNSLSDSDNAFDELDMMTFQRLTGLPKFTRFYKM